MTSAQDNFNGLLGVHSYANSFAASARQPRPPIMDGDKMNYGAGSIPNNIDPTAALQDLGGALKKTGLNLGLANKEIANVQEDISGESGSASVKRFAAAATTITSNIDKFTSSKDPATITSGVIGTIGGIALLIPPPEGEAIGAVFGLMSSIIGLFAGTGPSQLDEMHDMLDNAVKQIETFEENDDIKKLKAKENGVAAEYSTTFSYLVGFCEDGIGSIVYEDLDLIDDNAPITEGTVYMGQLNSAMNGMHTEYTNELQQNHDQWLNDQGKITQSIQLLALYSQLAVYRNLINQQLLMIYSAEQIYKFHPGPYHGQSRVLKNDQGQDLDAFQSMNTGYMLWIKSDTANDQLTWKNYRAYYNIVNKVNGTEQPPPEPLKYAAFTLNTDQWNTGIGWNSFDDIDVIDTNQIISNNIPLTGLGFYQKNNRIALNGITGTNYDYDNKLIFGYKSIADWDMNSNYFASIFWDESAVMVDNTATQAVFGVALYEYQNRAAIKIYYGNVDGTGTKAWKQTTAWDSHTYINTKSLNYEEESYDDYDADTILLCEFYDADVVDYAYSSGYMVGVQIYPRNNRVSLRLFKTLP
eukprot:21293_1